MPVFSQLPPLSLYIHLPWCERKCPYCDFNSHAVNELPEERYIQALIQDLEYQLPTIWGRRIVSVFMGGGTPSLFSPEAISRLISTIHSHLNCIPGMEITLEANPGSVEQQKFNEFFAAGINRLSMGIQSFDDRSLQALGRIHTAAEAERGARVAMDAGFENINLDLMFGLPQQSLEQGLADLRRAIELSPQHISWYQLTIEPNTLFYHQPPAVPDEDRLWALQQQGQQMLAAAGYGQYEISAYAKAGGMCAHNINYWQFGDYLALGAGAHGKISRGDTGEIRRYWQLRQPESYMRAAADKSSDSEILDEKQIVLEFMLNALRLKSGFALSLFEQHSGLESSAILGTCEQALKDGLMQRTATGFAASPQGYLFLNDLINRFA